MSGVISVNRVLRYYFLSPLIYHLWHLNCRLIVLVFSIENDGNEMKCYAAAEENDVRFAAHLSSVLPCIFCSALLIILRNYELHC